MAKSQSLIFSPSSGAGGALLDNRLPRTYPYNGGLSKHPVPLKVSIMHTTPRTERRIRAFSPYVFAGLFLAAASAPAAACTSILVTKGASADGSVIITYSCDLLGLYNELPLVPAADHKPGEMIDIPSRDEKDKRPRGQIPQVPHTYRTLGYMNEHQLAIAETTFVGREEFHNLQALVDCEPLMFYALQRAKTAREAIHVMTELVDKYGYGDEGESFSIGDTQEAWILEMVGTGPGGKGAIWAAVRVPDGQVSCTANSSRIGEIVRDDPANCLYSANVQSFAESRGWYDPKSGAPFRFCDAYGAATPVLRRICEARVWSILRRLAPSKHLSPDFHRSKPGRSPIRCGCRRTPN